LVYKIWLARILIYKKIIHFDLWIGWIIHPLKSNNGLIEWTLF